MFQVKDNTTRAKQIISIFWLLLGMTIVNMASLAWQYSLLIDAQKNPEAVDISVYETSDMLRGVISLAYLAVVVLSIVFFIMWFRRAYNNLHAIPNNNASLSEGWAAGAWFVPIVNLFRPFQIMNEIWKGTQQALVTRLGDPQSNAVVGWWWGLYLLTSFYNNIGVRLTWNAETIDELITSSKVDFIGEIISIPAILVTLQMIKRTHHFEKELVIHSQTPPDSIFSDQNNNA